MCRVSGGLLRFGTLPGVTVGLMHFMAVFPASMTDNSELLGFKLGGAAAAHGADQHCVSLWFTAPSAAVLSAGGQSTGTQWLCLCYKVPAATLHSVPFQKRHHVLQTAHPSPLSVYRGFFGCGHFSKANELLQKSGKKPINWKEL